MKRGGTDGNIIHLIKKPHISDCFETVRECKIERAYCVADKKRFQRVLKALDKCDPRGIWLTEFTETRNNIKEYIKALDYMIGVVDKKAIELFEGGK